VAGLLTVAAGSPGTRTALSLQRGIDGLRTYGGKEAGAPQERRLTWWTWDEAGHDAIFVDAGSAPVPYLKRSAAFRGSAAAYENQ